MASHLHAGFSHSSADASDVWPTEEALSCPRRRETWVVQAICPSPGAHHSMVTTDPKVPEGNRVGIQRAG